MAIRYIVVNEKLKPMKAFCAYDHVQLKEGYLHELSTGLLYHDVYCLKQHTLSCQEVVVQAKAS